MKKLLSFAILLFPSLACAEVMDKEWSLFSVWLLGITFAALTYISARYRPLLLLIVLPVSAFFLAGQLLEVTDNQVGPSIAFEAGASYILASWAGPIMLITCLAIGLAIRSRASRR